MVLSLIRASDPKIVIIAGDQTCKILFLVGCKREFGQQTHCYLLPGHRYSVVAFQDYVCCLFSDEIDRQDNEITRDIWENRCVDNSQIRHAHHAELAVEDGAVLWPDTDRTGARSMMAPGAGHDKIS